MKKCPYCAEVIKSVAPLRVPRERESRGRERWLSSEELARFQTECAPHWWPFFAMLFYTGARLGEAQGSGAATC